jgi:hypothetical protein
MATPKIQSVGGLKQYVLRKLGYPVHTIEITDEQLQDAIDDTLDDYLLFAYSGVQDRHVPIQFLDGVQDYVLPYNVFAVLSVNDANMSMMGAGQPSNLFSMNQFIAADLYRPGVAKIDLMGYELINQMTASMDIIFGKKQTFDYNSISKVLHLHATPHGDNKAVMQIYQKLDLTGTPISGSTRYEEENIYDDRWVKRMVTERARLQWGTNIGLKYQGSVLPNGGTINGQGIIEMAEKNIEALTTELHETYEMPTDFFVGVFVLCTLVGYLYNIMSNITQTIT